MTQNWHRLQFLYMRGRQGHIWAPSESVRTDSWLGWYPVETVLSIPLTWQEPSGQKSLFLVLFQREHIRENTIKVSPSTPTDMAVMKPLVVSFIVFVFVPKAYYTLISPKHQSLSNVVGVQCRYSGGGTLFNRVHSTMQHPDLQLEIIKKKRKAAGTGA